MVHKPLGCRLGTIMFNIVMTKTLGPMVEQCILNQTKGYWLFSIALFATFSIYDRLHRDYQVQVF